jgi:hypothetical protein
MELIGNRLLLPLIDATLEHAEAYKICDGVSITTLPAKYKNWLTEHRDLIARYESSLKFMKSALLIEPDSIKGFSTKNWRHVLELGVFVAMSIRLATGVPVDVPFWFDVDEDDEIRGCGNSLITGFRTGQRYLYPLDDGKQAEGLAALTGGFDGVLKTYVNDANSNVLIRAIQFAAIAFQTRHVQSRLVNNTIYLETLFSHSQTEISFQISSCTSWYLEARSSQEKRVELFTQIKELYNYRSKIVHGADLSAKNRELHRTLVFSEELNTRIFQHILNKNHVEVFGRKQDSRAAALKLLSLGAGGDFLV